MKKLLIGVGIIIVGVVVLLVAQPAAETEEGVSPEEKEFNQSGRPKAIEDETDLWQFHDDDGAGFSVKFPHDVALVDRPSDGLTLTVESTLIDDLDYPGFEKEEVLRDAESLKGGEFGEEFDWPLESSKKVRALDGANAQEFMVLSRFEVCDVTFERKLLFYNNDHRVILTLFGPESEIMSSSQQYFETNQDNCGDELVWNFDRQNDFYQDLADGKSSESAQRWFDVFDEVIDTIEVR